MYLFSPASPIRINGHAAQASPALARHNPPPLQIQLVYRLHAGYRYLNQQTGDVERSLSARSAPAVHFRHRHHHGPEVLPSPPADMAVASAQRHQKLHVSAQRFTEWIRSAEHRAKGAYQTMNFL
ncbi:MAG: hypothetical protein EPN70_01995 [Paraburkholderia sp.]|nr:MAG: hypothetical protein EPN70_01995 [Paraburkholderia sp.]